MIYLPPDTPDSGLTTDNCGNIVVWMRPQVVDDLISELENGDQSIPLAFMRELKTALTKHSRFSNEHDTTKVLEEM